MELLAVSNISVTVPLAGLDRTAEQCKTFSLVRQRVGGENHRLYRRVRGPCRSLVPVSFHA